MSTVIHIERDFGALERIVKSFNFSSVCLVTDARLAKLYGNLGAAHHILLPEGEACKSLDSAQACWEQFSTLGMDRSSALLGLGGGAVTDLTGFVASTYLRGITALYIPTTLLGMVDAAIGGKTAINVAGVKNAVGTFHLPRVVYINLRTLESLPERQLRSGLAEVIKYGCIADPALFSLLEQKPLPLEELVRRSIAIKQKVVQQDLTDRGARQILNFGHTLGHALESLCPTLLHGEAVAIGMVYATRLSPIDKQSVERVVQVIRQLGLPTELPDSVDPQALITQMRRDKKTERGKIRMILLDKLGHATPGHEVPEELLWQILS